MPVARNEAVVRAPVPVEDVAPVPEARPVEQPPHPVALRVVDVERHAVPARQGEREPRAVLQPVAVRRHVRLHDDVLHGRLAGLQPLGDEERGDCRRHEQRERRAR